MKKSRHGRVLMGAVIVLLAASAFQLIGMRNLKEGDRGRPIQPVGLSSQLPKAVAGWNVRDEPLGPNEAVTGAVTRNLNFDDYVYRTYEKGGVRIGVYVAYWAAGRMPVSKVASHTPDRCWVENGWKCDVTHFGEKLAIAGVPELPRGQGREFISPVGDREYVLYWHLVGSKLYDYGDRMNIAPDPMKWWRDTVSYAFSGSEAQYFIRLTSNQPFAVFERDPGFTEIVKAIAALGLRNTAEKAGS